MKKYIFSFLFIFLALTTIFSQQLKRITYDEMNNDGSFLKTITAEAYFMGWTQQKGSSGIIVENNKKC